MSVFKFNEYAKIGKSIQQNLGKTQTRFTKEQISGTWVATEKIHGCNFSFYCDGKEIQCGKRTVFLKETDSFHGFQQVRDVHKDKIFKLYNELQKFYVFDYLILFGEIFGGYYPNLQTDTKPIQYGVSYMNHKDFMAFDLCLVKESVPNDLSYSEMSKLCFKLDIPQAPLLMEGTYEEVMNYNTSRNSCIPNMYGMPELDEPNIIEGIVVRPKYFTNEDLKVKIKTQEFFEVCNIPAKPRKKQNTIKKIPIVSYVTENRLNAVRSKLNDNVDDEILFKEFVKDIKDEVEIDGGVLPKNIDNLNKLFRKKFDIFNA